MFDWTNFTIILVELIVLSFFFKFSRSTKVGRNKWSQKFDSFKKRDEFKEFASRKEAKRAAEQETKNIYREAKSVVEHGPNVHGTLPHFHTYDETPSVFMNEDGPVAVTHYFYWIPDEGSFDESDSESDY